jgi:hypothetical protein
MFAFFDRQKHRLEKLTAAIVAADDQTLAAALGRCAAPEIAVALRVLPLERANALLQEMPKDQLERALALTESGRGPDPQAAAKLVAALVQQQQMDPPQLDLEAAPPMAGSVEIREMPTGAPSAPAPALGAETATPAAAPPAPAGAPVDAAPLGLKALDIAGRVLGTFSVEKP